MVDGNISALVTLSLSLIQTIAVVGGLFAVLWQLSQVNRALKENVYSRAIDDYTQMMVQLLNKQHLNEFFYAENAEFMKLGNEERDFYNYIALSFGLFERIYILRKDLATGIWPSWDRWLREWFRSPLFDLFWSHEKSFFSDDFRHHVDRYYAEFKAQQTSPTQTVSRDAR